MITVKDQLNDTITLTAPAKRIVSLVPSQTELLHYLGLENEVLGISKFCIHPKVWFDNKTRIGGTKTIDIEKVKALAPDLIIGNKEENTLDDIRELREIAPVWMSDVNSLEQAYNMIECVGELTDRKDKALGLVDKIKEEFAKLFEKNESFSVQKNSVLYFIWKDPNYVAGHSTFIHDMLKKCGLVNGTTQDRYPEADGAEITPDYVFLSSEPYPFKEKDLNHFQKIYPASKIVLVDGEMFSWYGSRLLESPQYFRDLLSSI